MKNLYNGLKLIEKSSTTLLKKTKQINNTNKNLEPVESKKLFQWQNFQQTFYLYCYFILSFFSSVAILFSINFKLSYKFVTILDFTQEIFIHECVFFAFYYASPSSGEAYRDRRLTTNFELWVEIFFCLSVRLSAPQEKISS